MLNADTKRRINACRDILVGKVTDPKAQVEQITIALMYKFMNDMDHEVRDLGGQSQFFAGGFANYSWDRITDSRLGGEERIRLYAEGIEKVVANPGVPELFRQIFRNAYLPYRDPETFNLFSQEISGFRYEHSEDLGDAFEHLLSVMQSQGDAGQFRTPRHIIDFMVEVVKPRPSETILDPACGTAGFLISAYKHIVKHHNLTPAQMEELHRNVDGFDISPDMVRLSRVNLYLHQFADPHVFEYDTLTSEDRWGDRYDVILANPPFMTPKGGIRPHRKFSLESNRSEVLFVDYIAEHLMAGGRAAVIVPEGIIFQSGKAYKQLRRMLVENSLWAVASLPAGVFNPYSGVKTSILFFDRGIAEKGGPVLFAQIKADGLDLGAQRRVVAANDLPATLKLLNDAHHRLATGQVPSDFRDGLAEHPALTHLFVPRSVLLAEADCNLSWERYRVVAVTGPTKWPMVKLGELATIVRGSSPRPAGDPRYYGGSNPRLMVADLTRDGMRVTPRIDHLTDEGASLSRPMKAGDLVMAVSGQPGLCAILETDCLIHDGFVGFREWCTDKASIEFAYHYLTANRDRHNDQSTGAIFQNLKSDQIREFEIPLPPLSVQKEIVAEVARYQAVIDGARQVVENWKPSFTVDPEWPVVRLGNVAFESRVGLVRNKGEQSSIRSDLKPVPYIKMDCISYNGSLNLSDIVYVNASVEDLERYGILDGDLIYNTRNAPNLVGKSAVFHGPSRAYLPNNNLQVVRFSSEVLSDFVNLILNSKPGKDQIRGFVSGTTSVAALYWKEFADIRIPLPPLPIQQAIVERIDAERTLVESNKTLIELMKRRIEETMQRVWG